MADSVTATHGGVTVTTNTATSEAALRAELEGPPPESTPPSETPPAPESSPDAAAAQRARDEKGRFAPKGDAPAEAGTQGDVPATPPSGTDPPARDPSLPKHDPIARMKQALAQKAEAERRAEALAAELARYRAPDPRGGVTAPVTQALPGVTSPVTAPTTTSVGPEPQFEQFADTPDPYTAYMHAWARWDRATGIAQARAEWEAAQTAKTREQAFQRSLTEGRAHYQDFDAVLTEADTLGLQVSAVMQEAIADSPRSADLVYFLATHPEECIQLAEESRQTPVAAATVMRRLLESRLAPRPAAPAPHGGSAGTGARAAVSTAKPPVTPVGSSPVVSDEPPGESASASEHARYWNRKLKVPGTR